MFILFYIISVVKSASTLCIEYFHSRCQCWYKLRQFLVVAQFCADKISTDHQQLQNHGSVYRNLNYIIINYIILCLNQIHFYEFLYRSGPRILPIVWKKFSRISRSYCTSITVQLDTAYNNIVIITNCIQSESNNSRGKRFLCIFCIVYLPYIRNSLQVYYACMYIYRVIHQAWHHSRYFF